MEIIVMSLALRRVLFTLFILSPFLGACAAPTLKADPELPYPPSRPPEVGDILHLPTGTFVSESRMLEIATDSRIVYVGETHDNPAAHRVQLSVLTALSERYPGRVALGLEMFAAGQQPVLDRWIGGELTEKEFLRESGWYEQWKMDFDYYRDIFLFARERRIPMIGLNAEKDLVRTIGRKGPEGLTAEDRSQLPEMDTEDPYQRSLVQTIYGGHVKGEAQLEGFLRVQTLWDETMAENVAGFLSAPQGEEIHMMVMAGGNHVQYGFGIPRRVFRRLPTSYALVGSKEIVVPESKAENLMDVEIPRFPMLPYDFVVFTAYESLEKQGVRLGVMLREEDGRVRIEKVLPGSAAEESGLEPGDVLISFDGEPVKENLDIIYAVKQKQPGDRAVLEIVRDAAPMTLDVQFAPPEHDGGHENP
jgi:uncharacterized iron-regulated protein